MSEISIPSILKTAERITDALNRRFEKDAELYISHQQAQKIKIALRSSNLTAIKTWFQQKTYSPEILTKLILQNAWLMPPVHFKKLLELKPIFESCKQEVFLEIMEEVIENKYDISLDLKGILELLYYNQVSVNRCEQVLENGHNSIKVLQICLHRTIADISSSYQLYNKAKKCFNVYPNLEKSTSVLDVSQLPQDQQLELARQIFQFEILPVESPIWVWINTFNQLDKIAFDLVLNYLATRSSMKDPNQKKIVNKIIMQIINRDKENLRYFIDQLINLYRDTLHVRFSLIFGARRIRDLRVSQGLIREFQIIGIPRGILEEIAKEILAGADHTLSIESLDDIFEEIDRNSSREHMRYIGRIFRKHISFEVLFKELLAEYSDKDLIQDFVIELLRQEKNSHLFNIVLSYWWQHPDELFKEKLLALIEEKQFKSRAIQEFLLEQDFKLYKVIYSHTA